MSDTSRVLRVTGTEEKRLVEVLSSSVNENAYLLGLIEDYSVSELAHMQWGWFYWFRSQRGIEGVLYLDTTGLAVLSPSTPEALSSFAYFVATSDLVVNRIIAEKGVAHDLDQNLRLYGTDWLNTLQVFEEDGMVLRREDLASIHEPTLRLACPKEATEIAHGAAAAMREELNLDTNTAEMERLIRSKIDLINRERYYVLRADGRIIFQAFLSTVLKEVALVQGVWVPKEFRGSGIATRCVAEMCRRTFPTSDRILLRVQKRNLPAIAVYRKVGFKPFLDYLSIWYRT